MSLYADCHKKPWMLGVIMPNVVMLSVVTLNVVVPSWRQKDLQHWPDNPFYEWKSFKSTPTKNNNFIETRDLNAKMKEGRHDTKHKYTQYSDTQHNDTQNNDIQHNTQLNDIQHKNK